MAAATAVGTRGQGRAEAAALEAAMMAAMADAAGVVVRVAAALEVPMGENVRVVPHLTGSHSRDLGDWFFGGVGAHFSF